MIAGLAVWELRPGPSPMPQALPVMLPSATPGGVVPHVTPSPAPRSGLGHAQPPDPEALRDAPGRQATYDAEAKPGEFVTPPHVSIEH